MMISKMKAVAIFGAGYVLGAQAGRARYEQLKQQATRLAEHPKTQQIAQQAREKVTSRLPSTLSRRGGDATPDGAGSDLRTAPAEPTIDLTDASEPTTRPSHL